MKKGEYFDLEKPSDLQVFTGDIELSLGRFEGPLIIDEAQTLPGIFPILRALIDENRSRSGRYYLLGSVNPLFQAVDRITVMPAGDYLTGEEAIKRREREAKSQR